MSIQDFIQEAMSPTHKEHVVVGSKQLLKSLPANGLESVLGDTTTFITFEAIDTEVDADIEAVTGDEYSAETQQIDHQLAKQAIEEEVLVKPYDMAQRLPGTYTYFLMDPEGLHNDSPSEIATLKAMARSALQDPQRVIAAFVPVLSQHAPNYSAQNDGVDTIVQIGLHLQGFLQRNGVVSVEGWDELERHWKA